MDIDYSKIMIIAGDQQVLSHATDKDITWVKRSECDLADEIAMSKLLARHTPTLLIVIGLETLPYKAGGLLGIERLCKERKTTYLIH